MAERPKICADCGKLMGVGRECPYCGADNSGLSSRLKRIAAPAAGAGEGGLTVTGALVIINVFFYGTALVVGSGGASGGGFFSPDIEVLFRVGLQDNRAIAAGQWWRLFTMMFLHLGLLHVAFNCYILWIVGRLLEADLGPRATLVVYLGAGLAGSVGSWFANIGGAGASGAVFGVLAAVLLRRRLVDGDFRHPVTQQLLFLLGLNVVFALLVGGNINHVAHGAGFIAGGLLTWPMCTVTGPSRRTLNAAVLVGSWGLSAATLAAFTLMTVSLFAGSAHDVMGASRCWERVELAARTGLGPDAVVESSRCLRDIPRLETPANTARDAALRALDRAADAYRAGAPPPPDTRADVLRARAEYLVWEADALARYGLGYR